MSWLILLALLKKLDKKIDDLETVTFRKVDELPATGEANVIYFVPKETAEEGNYSDEYIWDSASESYEQIGDSMIDPESYKIFTTSIYSGSTATLENSTIRDIKNAIDSSILPIIYDKNSKDLYYLKKIQDNSYVFGQYMSISEIRQLTCMLSNLDSATLYIDRMTGATYVSSGSSSLVTSNGIFNALLPKVDYTTLAPTYSTSSTYALGDLVIYNNNLYECTTAITTAEAWTAAHWTQVKVSDELDKKANLTDIPADANHNIASAYDSTATYAVGDLCIYNGNLYECSTAISTAEAWDSTHWTQKTVAQELSGIPKLPSVTASDNGKILSVVNGAWNKANIASNIVYYRMTINGTMVTGYDRTIWGSEFRDLIKQGKIIYLCADGTGMEYVQFVSIYCTKSTVYFATIGSNGITRILPYSASAGAGYLVNVKDFLPSVTSSDEGKVLTVNSNGQWVASALPDGTNQQY